MNPPQDEREPAGLGLPPPEEGETPRLSEEQLRLAVESADLGLWDLDVLTGALHWPSRVRAMFGLAKEAQVSLEDVLRSLHPEDQATVRAQYAAAVDPNRRAPYDVEHRAIGKEDGVIRWIAAKGRAHFDTEGRCVRLIGTAVDITARKAAAANQAFLLDLLDRLRTATEPETIIATALEALARHLGAERVGYGHVMGDDATLALEACFAEGVAPITGALPLQSLGDQALARHRRGETVAMADVLAQPLRDASAWTRIDTRAFLSAPVVKNGRFCSTLFVNRRSSHAWTPPEISLVEEVADRLWDAVGRARAEDALKRMNASLEEQVNARSRDIQRIWRLSPLVMVVGDQAGRLIEANPAWTSTLGWAPEDTLGRDVMQFVAPEDRDAGAAGMSRLFGGEPVIEFVLRFLTRSGDRRAIAWTTVPDGERLYGFGRDITQQIQAEDHLRQAQKLDALGRLTGGIAHDFNNLLQGMAGSLDLIRRKAGDAAAVRLWADAGLQAGERGAKLTSQLLAFSRAQKLEICSAPIAELVMNMADLLDRTLGPNVIIDRVLPETPLWVRCDPTQLEMAILNLAINARDAMDARGRLTITVRPAAARGDPSLEDGDYVEVSVADSGSGMSPEVRGRAFDPFFTTKPSGKGTGLGLSQVYASARQAGGTARIESEPGKGTVVSLFLPRASAESPPPGDPRPFALQPAAPALVLVVDDDADVRRLLVASIQSLGYQVIEAAGGHEGLGLLEQRAPDAMILDYAMPGITGAEVAKLARTRRPNLPVLFASGYSDTAEIQDIEGAAVPILRKPFRIEELGSVLERTLQAARETEAAAGSSVRS